MKVEIDADLLRILFMDEGPDLSDEVGVANAIGDIVFGELTSLSEWGELSDKAEDALRYYRHKWNLDGWNWEEGNE